MASVGTAAWRLTWPPDRRQTFSAHARYKINFQLKNFLKQKGDLEAAFKGETRPQKFQKITRKVRFRRKFAKS